MPHQDLDIKLLSAPVTLTSPINFWTATRTIMTSLYKYKRPRQHGHTLIETYGQGGIEFTMLHKHPPSNHT
mgnify:CR=1 FL=1